MDDYEDDGENAGSHADKTTEVGGSCAVKSEAEDDSIPAERGDTEELRSEEVSDPAHSETIHEIFKKSEHPLGAWKRVGSSPEAPKMLILFSCYLFFFFLFTTYKSSVFSDFQLPTEAEGRKIKPEVEVKPEDIVVFTEKTASLPKKKKNLDAPIEFKKRKTNLNIRRQKNGT